VIDNGKSGFIDTNPARLWDGMHELLGNPGLARQLGAGARRRARERFGIERFSADWDAALRHVCA
jgi:glycosyltransferase involved in cell wall biosynthesis